MEEELQVPSVLVVDDEPINAQILASMLSQEYHVKVAGDGPTALEIAEQFPQPDLILLDIMMPEMDGFEVCNHLKSNVLTRHIPIIFVTASIDAEAESQGLRLGAVDYITKPIHYTITRLRVKNHLAFRQSQLALLERGAFLDALIANAPNAIWVISIQHQWLILNKIAQIWLGLNSLEQANQNPGLAFIHPEYQVCYQHAVQNAANGTTTKIELLLANNVRWLELSISPLPNAHGNITSVLNIATDISRRKRDESRLRLSAKVFENAQEGILFTDPQGTIQDVNPAFTRITGYRRNEVLRQNTRLFNSGFQNQDFYQKFWQTLKETGHWQGEIKNRRKNGELLPEWLSVTAIQNPEGKIEHYLAVFSDITQIKQHEAQLERTAHFDSLTGIPNRILLYDRLKQAIAQANREQKMLAVCYLDLDGFKPINDEFGHQAGDRVLTECAHRISQVIREMDTVARLGGDEFVILLQNIEQLSDCSITLDRLLTAIAAPLGLDNRFCMVSASIGITLYPLDKADSDLLLRHADQAMYIAKQSGKNRYHYYDRAHADQLDQFTDSLQRIHQGLADQEFELFYQPKLQIQTQQIIGAEALLRWRHPERGVLLPLEFLPSIQNSKLGIKLEDWVLEQALNQQRLWHEQGLQFELSINISANYLHAENFISNLQNRLAAFPELPRNALQIEILESVVLEDFNKVSLIIASCQKIGVGFALDNFGSGYSSLTYLSNLPAETIKIEQTFVRDMLQDEHDLSIIQGIVALGNAFERKIVAEGVETAQQLQILARMGCHFAQGYWIAPPMPADNFLSWCQTHNDNDLLTTAK